MEVKVCACDIIGCKSVARVSELSHGAIQCPPEWCEVRAFPPGENRMLAAHVCPDCWRDKVLPLFEQGFARDRERLDRLQESAAMQDPTWLSGAQIVALKRGATISVDKQLAEFFGSPPSPESK